MNSDYENILDRHEKNIALLLSKFETSLENNRILEYKLNEKQKENEAYKEKLDFLTKQNENLKLAKALISEGEGEQKEAKIRLNKIIREIDNCIALLNK
jgi:hypothetical protein